MSCIARARRSVVSTAGALVALASVVIVFSAQLATANPASFEGLGDLTGGATFSAAYDVDFAGQRVVGTSKSGAQPHAEAFVWDSINKMQGLGSLSGFFPRSEAFAISLDGSSVVGTAKSAFNLTEAFRWRQGTGMVGLGFLQPGADFSVAIATNATGDIVGGFSRAIVQTAFSWSATNGMKSLGFAPGYNSSRLTGGSADGMIFTGYVGEIGSDEMETVLVTLNGAGQGTLVPLGFPAGTTMSDAADMSANGDVIVGTAENGVEQAFCWTLGSQFSILQPLPGADGGEAFGVSPDGSVIGGTSGGKAVLWERATTGQAPPPPRDVQQELGAVLDLGGWTLTEVRAIAGDNRTIVGNGINPQGKPEGWIATLGDATVVNPSLITAGRDFTCAIIDAALRCWGNNGAAGIPDSDPGPYTAVGGGELQVCAIEQDSSATCWPESQLPGDATDLPAGSYVQIAGGRGYTCGRLSDATLSCTEGAPGPVPTGTFVDFDASPEFYCAVRDDGTVTCRGEDGGFGRTQPPAGLTDAVRVSTGDENACAVREKGELECWGGNDDDQSDPPTGTASAVECGSLHCCAIRTPLQFSSPVDEVACWGKGEEGEPDGQADAPEEIRFSALATGGDGTQSGHSCAVDENDVIRCWGNREDGQACPPGDPDCDGIPDLQGDNCPGVFNPDQLDESEAALGLPRDGVGDACDLCLTEYDPNQFDSDFDEENGVSDGFGDECDVCPEVFDESQNALACVQPEFIVSRLDPTPPPPGQGGGSGGSATQNFDVSLRCGNDVITQAAIGVDLGPTTGTITVGNNCTPSGCDANDASGDPFFLLGDAVASPDPDTFASRPGDPNRPAEASPTVVYLSAAGEGGVLCQNGNTEFLARISVTEYPDGVVPPLTTDGVVQTTENPLVSTQGQGPLDSAEIQLTNGDPENAIATVELLPFVSSTDPETDDGTWWLATITASERIDRLHVAFTGDGDLSFVGCANLSSDACISELPVYDCQAIGNEPSGSIGPDVDFTSMDSRVFGPAAEGANLSGLADVQENAIYVSLEARLNGAAPFESGSSFRAFNKNLQPAIFGVVRFVPNTSTGGSLVAPGVTYRGVETIFNQDRDQAPTCPAVETPFPVFGKTVPDESVISLSEIATVETAVLGEDPDGDNRPSDFDICPNAFDPSQLDRGSVRTPEDPDGFETNNIGDECECASLVGGDGRSLQEDLEAVQDVVLGDLPAGAVVDRCSHVGDLDCDLADWAVLARVQAGFGSKGENCAPSVGASSGSP